ncbi:MAG: DNA repair protein RecN [Pseudomonadota bacterium]
MLSALSIRDIVLIDTLDLEFNGGLSALTGETGAGKSILLGALALACGDRADRAKVRAGAAQGSAAAVFDLSVSHPAWPLLDEAGVEAEPGETLILRRTVTADGRSRAHINDQPASVGLLRSLGAVLVEIHGQHDGRGLLDPKTHRGLLDAHARNASQRMAVTEAWRMLAEARQRLEDLTAARDRSAEEEGFLRHAVEELDALQPGTGEEGSLAEERKFLQQAERALEDLQDAQSALGGDQGLGSRLNSALRGLERVRDALGAEDGDTTAHDGPTTTAQAALRAVERAAGALDRALIEFNEAEDALTEAGRAFVVEPGRLEQVEERLFALRAAARKHETEVDQLAALRSTLAERLDAIENADDRVREAAAALAAVEADYARSADALTATRVKAADALARSVMTELAPLKLDKAQFRVAVQTDEARAGPHGCDQVFFEVSTNPGTPFGPLDKIASGGELSRFGLALKVCLAADEDGRVLIFDEVDQGVGGAVADAVGARLLRLAEGGQTLVVTHSPQVAARADHHMKIEKSAESDSMRTNVRSLDSGERREEIARMLSGAEITEAARAAADQLMNR